MEIGWEAGFLPRLESLAKCDGFGEGCYLATKNFPREEMFGLTSQIRRAASPIAANIAEGYGREQTGSFIQYLRMSQGSLKELETHIILSQRVRAIPREKAGALLGYCDELGKMLRAFIRSLQKRAREN